MNMAPSLALGVTVFVGMAFALLATSFLQDDFSVAVVAANSNSSVATDIQVFSAVGEPRGIPAAVGAHPLGLDDRGGLL